MGQQGMLALVVEVCEWCVHLLRDQAWVIANCPRHTCCISASQLLVGATAGGAWNTHVQVMKAYGQHAGTCHNISEPLNILLHTQPEHSLATTMPQPKELSLDAPAAGCSPEAAPGPRIACPSGSGAAALAAAISCCRFASCSCATGRSTQSDMTSPCNPRLPPH
jgi:hypothetical protein